jgi:hypothetical protein
MLTYADLCWRMLTYEEKTIDRWSKTKPLRYLNLYANFDTTR